MAEGFFRKGLPGVQVSSAGLMAMVGYGADPVAQELMSKAGVDISDHRARMLNENLVRDADLILVMEDVQKQMILSQYPFANGKVFRLDEMDIPDPFQRDRATFDKVFSLIDFAVGNWVRRINKISE